MLYYGVLPHKAKILLVMMSIITRRLRPVTNFQKKTHQALCDYAKGIALALTGNLTFPTPPVPLVDQGTANDAYTAAILAWGPVGNRGSHAQHLAVLDARAVVEQNLTMLADYVDSVSNGVESTIVSSGFVASRVPAPLGPLSAPTNFRSLVKKDLISGQLNLKWDRVNGAACYQIFAAATPTDPFVLIATVSKTSYMFNGIPGRLGYYTVRAFGTAGLGVETAPLQAHTKF